MEKEEKLSVKEIKDRYNSVFAERFAKTRDTIALANLTKTESRTFTVFSKTLLRSYMQNPKNNETNLRSLSRFLYRLSYPYRRLVKYYAEMIDLDCVSVIPLQDIENPRSEDEILKEYTETLKQLQKMNMKGEIYKCVLTAWIEDAFFGYIYEDDSNFFIMPLPSEYCRVSSINYDGTLNFAFDFTYFRKYADDLEYWDSDFKKMFNKYQSDNSLRWQELDIEKTICLKVNIEDFTMCLPPFVGLFESLIDLVDLQSIQAVKDELSIYKLIVARLQPLSGTDEPDNFEVDISTALEYFDKFAASLPDQVNAAISPLPIETIEFKDNTTQDVDALANAQSNLLKMSGGSQILDNDKTGSTIYEAQILSDTLTALKPLLPQIQAWVNRYLGYTIGEHASVKYLEVSPYTKNKKKKELLESGQNGVPVKLAVASLDGFNPLETMSLDFLENKVLKLHETWIPFATSYTQTSDSSHEKDVDDLTDEGIETKEQDKNDM